VLGILKRVFQKRSCSWARGITRSHDSACMMVTSVCTIPYRDPTACVLRHGGRDIGRSSSLALSSLDKHMGKGRCSSRTPFIPASVRIAEPFSFGPYCSSYHHVVTSVRDLMVLCFKCCIQEVQSNSCIIAGGPNQQKSSLCAINRRGRPLDHSKEHFESYGVWLYPHPFTKLSNSIEKFWPAGRALYISFRLL
jgi:hypothetical protein